MTLDAATVFSGTLLFAKVSAVMLSAPMIGAFVPVTVRVFASLLLTWALLPVSPYLGAPLPTDVVSLATTVAGAAGFGLLTGISLQAVVWAFQTAGNVLDLQIGTGSAQLFNPLVGGTSTPIGQFNAILASVLVFITDSHHLVIRGMVAAPREFSEGGLVDMVSGSLQAATLSAVQIAAPVVCATVLIDVAAALVSRAVPQAQPFWLALPVKLAAGLLLLAGGLPGLALVARELAQAVVTP